MGWGLACGCDLGVMSFILFIYRVFFSKNCQIKDE